MKKVAITVSIEDERLNALTFFMKKNNATPQKELERTLEELYQKHVPPETREYLESKLIPAGTTKPRPKRPDKPAASTLAPMQEGTKEEPKNG